LIEQWFSQGLQGIYCGVESTGGYENNWYDFLKGVGLARPVKVSRLNPKGVKAVIDASLKRTITDAVSAENIAVYLLSFPEKVQYHVAGQEETAFKEGRQLYTYVRMLVKQKVQLNNQLEKLLYQYFPELLVYCRRGIPSWLLRMLARYSCASAVIKAGATRLTSINGISSTKAAAILAKAGTSNQVVRTETQHLIAATSRELLHKEERINEEKEYLRNLYQDDPQVKLLTTTPGIGVDTAVILLLEIEDINRFGSARKLACYFGLHPTYKQSGDGIWKVGMSKKGRGAIRAALYMAALTSIRWNPVLKDLYARFRAKGMKHYQAIGVVMHKLLRITFGILKSNTGFDAEIDRKNVERSAEKKKQQDENNQRIKTEKLLRKHRFSKVTVDAPISRIKANKIKQMASQTSMTEVNTGLPPALIKHRKNV
jgi:transposase